MGGRKMIKNREGVVGEEGEEQEEEEEREQKKIYILTKKCADKQ